MKAALQSKRLRLALAALVLLVIATIVLWPRPPRQIITLANGDQYEFAGATYGTNPVPPSLLCRITDRLPSRYKKLARKVFGNRVAWQSFSPAGAPTFDRPVLAVWFRQVHVSHLEFGAEAAPDVWLGDQNDFTISEIGPGIHITYLDRSRGWFCRAFTVVPKRSSIVHALVSEGSNATRRIAFRNPAFGNYPRWQATNPLPASIDFSDLHVRVDAWVTNRAINEADNYSPSARIFIFKQTNTAWTITGAELSDATGDVLHFATHSIIGGPRPAEGLSFSQPPWPGEDAWRLKMQFAGSNQTTHTVELYVNPLR